MVLKLGVKKYGPSVVRPGCVEETLMSLEITAAVNHKKVAQEVDTVLRLIFAGSPAVRRQVDLEAVEMAAFGNSSGPGQSARDWGPDYSPGVRSMMAVVGS